MQSGLPLPNLRLSVNDPLGPQTCSPPSNKASQADSEDPENSWVCLMEDHALAGLLKANELLLTVKIADVSENLFGFTPAL